MGRQGDGLDLIRQRLGELRQEQQQLEARYHANARVIAELENLLRRAELPPTPPAQAGTTAGVNETETKEAA